MTPPAVILFGGCNGAGKTTLAFQYINKGLDLHEFVNADEIARGLNPLNPKAQEGLASRLAIQRVNTLIDLNQSFAFEGTLSGSWQAKILKRCTQKGYQSLLIYVWLPSVEFAKQRVKNRVIQGGHDVPGDIIERRYHAGITNLKNLYLPIVSNAAILDGTDPEASYQEKLIAQKRNHQFEIIQPDKWRLLCQKNP
jgi:predicted ABC-type ATPase